ncbi:MAG: hypothetical protein H0W43_01700 [Chthoniobacterales bacterium]|nr:hypothetical protein [Chthoniobacterales bacterium]
MNANPIMAKVDKLMALVDALETRLATALLAAALGELTNSPERHSSQQQKAA